MRTTIPKVALGAWSWGQAQPEEINVFENALSEKDLQPVFDKAME